MEPESYAIGIDLGATKVAAALVSSEGEVIVSRQFLTHIQRGTTAVLDAIALAIQQLLLATPAPVQGIGIGSPGLIDSEAGIVHESVNLNWVDLPLAEEIQARLPNELSVLVHRDAYAEVLGEFYFGAGQGSDNLVYLGLGSGLGSGIIANGRLITGVNNHASEIGHLSLDVNGRLCNCGLCGCAETILSGNGILGEVQMLISQGIYETSLVNTPALNSQQIIAAAQNGDALATAVIAKAGDWLGQIISMYTIILNPERIIIGGGFGKAAFPLLLPCVQETLRRTVLHTNQKTVQIVPSQLLSSAIGAACLVWYSQNHNNLQRG